MSLTTTTGRGELALQPGYFSSSAFVKAFRDDITSLIHAYHDSYGKETQIQPFQLFKQLWVSLGWKWLHFSVPEDRARDAFLHTACRLFIERTVRTEAPFTRAVALYGLHTFFHTQPSGTLPLLRSIAYIPIPIDQHTSLLSLPGTLQTPYLVPLAPAARNILSQFGTEGIFLLIPSSECGPFKPRSLPYEVVLDDTITTQPPDLLKKKGRPSKRERSRRAKNAVENLEKWLQENPHQGSDSLTDPSKATAELYHLHKASLLDKVDESKNEGAMQSDESLALLDASKHVVQRLKAAEMFLSSDNSGSQTTTSSRVGIERMEQTLKKENRGGLLSLLGN
ncbi:hypothetical protein BDN72DRAFT_754013 [Pluteus cervinus]|uniref:Uncharacterized protein n=1 Tax=Pluteus cervinus TaxID=181527 RepID=A0ACD3BI27_9AGAR|nr:hypothetical protein BDN72DRAFT_754013 [Pluteus cervinus]